MSFFYRRNIRKIQKELQEKEDVDFEQPLIAKDLTVHFKGIFSGAGFAYLLSDRLVFVPYKSTYMFKTLTVMLSDIISVSTRYWIIGVKVDGLKIILKSGDTETFAINRDSSLFKEFVKLKTVNI
jgi:hypothetical protein